MSNFCISRNKKKGIARKGLAENLIVILADSYPHWNEQGKGVCPRGQGKKMILYILHSLFLESRSEHEGDGQGQAQCAKHIGNYSKREP